MVQPTDCELLARAAAGDAEAYAAFFRRHVAAVTRYGIRRCDNAEQVAELIADTFLVALEASGRYREMHDTALPWLFGIARRVLAGHRRRRYAFYRTAGFQPVVTPDEADAIVAAIDASRLRSELEHALRALPDSEREVFLLVAHDGLSPSEAAVALDVTPNAARLRLSRARKKLREDLEPAVPISEVSHAW